MTADDLDLDELADLMAEGPGPNYGRKASPRLPLTSDTHDGERWAAAYRSLDPEVLAGVQLVDSGGAAVYHRSDAAWHGSHGYEPGEATRTLSADEWQTVDHGALQVEVLGRLGFTPAQFQRISKPGGRRSPELDALRAAFDEALLQAVEAGTNKVLLARSLGLYVERNGTESKRLKRCLQRAHQARIAPRVARWNVISPEQGRANACLGQRIRKALPCRCGMHGPDAHLQHA